MLLCLDAPPSSSDPLFWTDFVELKALIHPDRCYSRGDLVGLLRRNRDTQSNRATHDESKWRDIVSFAQNRAIEFGDAYPFNISADIDTIELIFDDSDKQKAYLKLLLSSLMRHVPDNSRGGLARFFEEACLTVFGKLMPEGSEIHPNWANGGETARYQGTLFQKMTSIASDIRCTANFQLSDFKPNDTGDGGIDLVAWHPMTDRREGIPIAFAQCGCSKEDWKFKHLEASYAKHHRHLPVMHPWATYYFMPLDLRQSSGDWAYKSDIGDAIIVDRLRLLRLSAQYNLWTMWPRLPLLNTVMQLSST